MVTFSQRTLLAVAVLGIIGVLVLGRPEMVAASEARIKFPPGLTIGTISGPGQDKLTKALQEYQFKGDSGAVLSGTVNWAHNITGEREIVPLESPAGEAYPIYKPDPFTLQVWLSEETPIRTSLENFPLKRFRGSLVFDWQLSGPGENKNGQAVINIDRTSGGYLAEQGLTIPLTSGDREIKAEREKLEQRLVEELVLVLLLDLGRHPASSEIETGDGPLCSQAKKLAAQGDWNGAKGLWLEVLTQNPKYGPPLFNLGLYHEWAKQPEEAWKYYQKAFAADGTQEHRVSLARLTQALDRAGRAPKVRN